MYAFLDIRIQIILVTEETGSLLLGAASLEEIWCLGGVKSKMCLARVQKLSIELRLIQHVRWCG